MYMSVHVIHKYTTKLNYCTKNFVYSSSHGGNVPELVRLQTEELHRMKGLLNEYVYQINQLQVHTCTCTI